MNFPNDTKFFSWPEKAPSAYNANVVPVEDTSLDWNINGTPFRIFIGEDHRFFGDRILRPFLYIWYNGHIESIRSMGAKIPGFDLFKWFADFYDRYWAGDPIYELQHEDDPDSTNIVKVQRKTIAPSGPITFVGDESSSFSLSNLFGSLGNSAPFVVGAVILGVVLLTGKK